MLKELLVSGGYDPVLPFLAGPPRHIVDLGANIGLVSRWLLSRYPAAKLVAVEPEPGNVAVLRENLSQFGTNTLVIPACVGASERRVRMVTDSGEWGFHMEDTDATTSSARDQERPDSVDVVTMESVLRAMHGTPDGDVDLVKCDIEGAEAELFQSCEGWIRRVKLLVIECHGSFGAEALAAAVERCGGRMECVWRSGLDQFQHELLIMRRS